MITSDFKDSDGFRLQFEESVPDEERKFYMKTFPKVDDVSKDRIHCTTCDCHVGTAPISEKIIRTHQILNVTQCNKCFAFYNSGEFGKGEDGSEYYCRWCGQGGEVFCCSSCPFVFCNKCIRDNLTDSYVKEIEENDDWSCFVCNKEILKRLRAQHWALRNFMNKQLEKIQKVNINSEEELNNLLNEDQTNCCPKKKRKLPLPKPAPAPIKRPNGGTILSSGFPPAKKPNIAAVMSANKQGIKVPVNTSFNAPKQLTPRPLAPKKQSEVVCTPDIMGIFNEQAGASSSSTSAPPPLAMRQIQRPAAPRTTLANPIYHTVNGFQIDLNQASRQEIFRLPNGKLIQVRKQTNPTPPNPRMGLGSANLNTPTPRAQFTIRPTTAPMTTTSRMMRPQAPQMTRIRAPNTQQRFSFSDGRVVSGGGGAAQATPTPAASTTVASTIFTQQNGTISVARAPQPDTPFGKAKTGFEDRIIQGLEICQHTINKMITLTNSTSFKTSRSFSDLKELYIHLQYLFTYTGGKVKTLQENLITGMEELAKFDEALKEKDGDNDDLEVVTQKVDIIEVLSDDEDAEIAAKKTAEEASKKTDGEDTEIMCDPSSMLETVLETPPEPETSTVKVINQQELLASLNIVVDDEKLNKRTAVKIERLEDSKSSVIKQFMVALQQRRDAVAAESSEEEEETDDAQGGSEDFELPLIPEVVLELNTTKENDGTVEENPETVNPESSEKESVVADVVEIASDDEEPVEKQNLLNSSDKENLPEKENGAEEVPTEKENSSEKDNDEEVMEVGDESQTSQTDESVKIDNELPVELMEVDDETKDPFESEKSSNGVEPVSLENGVNHETTAISAEDTFEEDKTGSDDQIKKAQSTDVIDDEKDLLDTLINSLDEPLASIDVEIPEPLS